MQAAAVAVHTTKLPQSQEALEEVEMALVMAALQLMAHQIQEAEEELPEELLVQDLYKVVQAAQV